MPRPHDAGTDSAAGTVLVADNDRAVSGLLTEVLVRSGLRVVHAYDGHAAASMARDPVIRAIVCDLDMPGASGLEVLASLADLPTPPAAVVVSGYLDADVRAKLARLPFVRRVFAKPFDLRAFAACVQEACAAAAPAVERGADAGEAGRSTC